MNGCAGNDGDSCLEGAAGADGAGDAAGIGDAGVGGGIESMSSLGAAGIALRIGGIRMSAERKFLLLCILSVLLFRSSGIFLCLLFFPYFLLCAMYRNSSFLIHKLSYSLRFFLSHRIPRTRQIMNSRFSFLKIFSSFAFLPCMEFPAYLLNLSLVYPH